MQMKPCYTCRQIKPLSEFYAHSEMADGHENQCKSCVKQIEKARWEKNKTNPEWLMKERERKRIEQQRRRDAGLVPPVTYEAIKKWSLKNPHKVRAHNFVNRANRRPPKPQGCEQCGAGGILHKHHDDYSKPMDIRWLCPKCHGKLHRKDFVSTVNQGQQQL